MTTYRLLIALCVMAIVLVSGCTSSTTTASVDPIAGSWSYQGESNGTSYTATLVFSPEGNFNGYMLGLLSLSGHWTKVNATDYNVYYNNQAKLFVMNGEKNKIWDAVAPEQIFAKQ